MCWKTRRGKIYLNVIHQLKTEHDVGFIYISHRYAEVYELGDRVTILRDGKNVGTFEIEGLSFDTMIEKMIGGQVEKQYPKLSKPADDYSLQVEDFKSSWSTQ